MSATSHAAADISHLSRRPPQPSASANTETTRLLFAISQAEKTLFLSHAKIPVGIEGTLEVEWCFQDGDYASLEKKLHHFRPHVIVTGWSTSPALTDWLTSPDCTARYICHLAGTVRHLVPRTFIEKGGLVTNWGALAGETVAEHALLLALAAMRNLPRWAQLAHQSITNAEPPFNNPVICLQTQSLFRRRVGIHGFGAVARALLRLLRPFEVQATVYSQGVPEALIYQQGATPATSLSTLFSDNDVIFECESLTPLTEKVITAELLALIPTDGIFVNIGRGRLVDEPALMREAESQRIRVAIDVVADEPLRTNSPWFKIKGALLSPHIGGPSADCYPRLGIFAMQNVGRFLASDVPQPGTLEALVTPSIYDRST